MIAEINDLASVGQVNDVPAYNLPPEVFTTLNNMRFTSDGIEVILGWKVVMEPSGGHLYAPHFAMPVKTPSQTYWVYVSLTKAAVYDGTSDTDITRASGGNYAANRTADWNGAILGGVLILNNGIDIPQFWATTSPATKLANLTNWTSTLRAKIIRSMGPYLVAFNLTDSGTNYPHLVQWSQPADPGSVPSSWAYSDPTKQGGRKDLPDVNSGEIKDAGMLQDTMFIYKETSIWKMRIIGGTFVMDFGSGPWLENVGILAARCWCLVGDGLRHCVVTQDDMIVHNGNSQESVLFERQKKSLFAELNREALDACFLFVYPNRDEIWFCYPEAGQTQATKAMIWNYRKGRGAISFVDGINFRNAILGDIQDTNFETWATGSDVWDTDTGPWSQLFRQKIVLCGTDNSKFFQMDIGSLKYLSNFAPSAIRQDLAIDGRKRNGQWINNFRQLKMVDGIFPKVDGAAIRVRVGFSNVPGGAITWQPYTDFNPAQQPNWVNPLVDEELPGCGVTFSVEFSAVTGARWRLNGYSLSVIPVGDFYGV